jgi:hypothetical protein
MNEHLGVVLLCYDDGRILNADADLIKDASGTWSGTLSFPVNAGTGELLKLVEGSIQIGNRVGRFVRPDVSDWFDSPDSEFQIRILGNGYAPF